MQLHTQKVTMQQRMPLLLRRTLKKRTPQNRWLPTMHLKDTRLWATRLKVMELQAMMATVPHTTLAPTVHGRRSWSTVSSFWVLVSELYSFSPSSTPPKWVGLPV